MKNLSSRLLSAALSGSIFISSLVGCPGLERKTFDGLGKINNLSEFEIAEQRDGLSEKEWQDQILLFSFDYNDKENFWQPPKVTIEKGSGDCEDFATLSCFYSGHRYGNNILVLGGYDLEKKKIIFHAVHLLQEREKFGSRGYHGDNIPAEYDLNEVLKELQKRKTSIDYMLYWIINLDEINPQWRTTRDDLMPDYERLFIEDKTEMRKIDK